MSRTIETRRTTMRWMRRTRKMRRKNKTRKMRSWAWMATRRNNRVRTPRRRLRKAKIRWIKQRY